MPYEGEQRSGDLPRVETEDIEIVDDRVKDGQDVNLSSIKDTKYSWVVCFAGFFLQVIVVGFLHVFGIFFVFFIEEFGTSKAKTAWLGSIAYGLNMAFGCITGLIEARIGTRPVLMIGSAICTLSLIGSSFAPSIEVLFVTFSVIYGIGSSMAYTPTMCLSQVYFDKYASLSTGIMVSGSSVGTLILSPITQALLENLGWRNSFRVFAAVLFITIFFGALVKPVPISDANRRQQHSQSKQFLAELKIWKNRVFILWTIAMALSFFGYYIILVHLVSHAEDLGIKPEKGSTLLIFQGASTAVGRVMWGKIVQWRILNRLNLHQASMIMTGTGYMLLPMIKSYGGLIAYCTIHGLVDGCFVVLLPIVTSKLVGSEKASVAWGFLVGVSSLTFMTGPPIAGMISDATGSYELAFHIAAIPLMIAALLLFLIPWAQRTATTTNSLHEIRSYIPAFPPPSDSEEGEEMGENMDMNLLDEDGYIRVKRTDVPSAKSVHFADLAESRWRSTGQLNIKKNRSLEYEGGGAEKPRTESSRRRRCISESVDASVDSEPLDIKSLALKPIKEQPVDQQTSGELIRGPATSRPTSQQNENHASTQPPESQSQGNILGPFEQDVRNALRELEANNVAICKSISENESHDSYKVEANFAQPVTSWEGHESQFSSSATSPLS